MSPVQFYVSVAVMPTVTVIALLLGIVWNNNNINARFQDLRSELSSRLNDFNNRFADFSARLAELSARVSETNDRIDELGHLLGHRIDEMGNRIDEMGRRIDGVSSRVGEMGHRIDGVSSRVDDVRDLLRAEMTKNHSELLARFGELDTRLTRLETQPK